LKADHFAVPVIREMIEADPLKRINLTDVKERLLPYYIRNGHHGRTTDNNLLPLQLVKKHQTKNRPL
jgi:hypothetical protein